MFPALTGATVARNAFPKAAERSQPLRQAPNPHRPSRLSASNKIRAATNAPPTTAIDALKPDQPDGGSRGAESTSGRGDRREYPALGCVQYGGGQSDNCSNSVRLRIQPLLEAGVLPYLLQLWTKMEEILRSADPGDSPH